MARRESDSPSYWGDRRTGQGAPGGSATTNWFYAVYGPIVLRGGGGTRSLAFALADAHDRGLLPDNISDLLAEWFIENLIAPHTGETPQQVRNRLSATPTPAPTATPTPIPTATAPPLSQWGRYKNGVYGYDIGVPPGWTLHKASETNEYAFFSAPDLGGTNEVWTEDPGGSPTLESLAEARRSKLTTQARDKSWPVFEIVSDRKIAAGGGEFYEIVFRRQVGDGYCTSLVIERLHLVSLYPRGLDRISPALWAGALSIFAGDRSSDKHSYQVGVVTRASVCESHLGAYLAITETFQDSFSVWNRYWDDNYGYGLNVPPGWSAQQIYGGSTFTAPDQSAVVEVTAHYYSLNETVEALKAWRLGEYREYANEWTSFEWKGNIQSLCRPGRVICLPS